MAATSGMCDYLALALNDHHLGVASYTPPTALRVSLYTARGTDAQSNAGTNFTEVSGNGYPSPAPNIGVGSTNWNAAALSAPDRKSTNKLEVTIGTPTGAGWGDAIGAVVKDQSGNYLWWVDFAAPKSCPAGVPVVIPAAQLSLNLPRST